MILFRRNGPLPSFSLALSSLSLKSSSLIAEGDSTSYGGRGGSPSRSLMRTMGRRSQETYEFSRSFFLPDNFMSDADSDFETEFGDWDDQRSFQTVFDDQPTKNRLSSLRRLLLALLRKYANGRLMAKSTAKMTLDHTPQNRPHTIEMSVGRPESST